MGLRVIGVPCGRVLLVSPFDERFRIIALFFRDLLASSALGPDLLRAPVIRLAGEERRNNQRKDANTSSIFHHSDINGSLRWFATPVPTRPSGPPGLLFERLAVRWCALFFRRW